MSWLDTLSSHPIFRRLGLALLEFVWQGAVIATLWAAARAVLARARPSIRYAAGCAALVAMAALPCLTFWRATAEPSLPLRPRPAQAAPAIAQDHFSSIAPADPSQRALALPRALRGLARSIEPWPVLVWAAGVLLLCLRFLGGWAASVRLRRSAKADAPALLRNTLIEIARQMRISRPVRLLESAAIRVPMALGILRPVILLPLSGLCGLSPAQLEALLAHELAHVRRHDYFVNLLQTAVETLLFYHPAVWWISRNVRLERENCCDDLAVAAMGDPRVYARALLALEEQRAERVQLALAATGGSLLPRIARLFPRFGAEPSSPGRAGALLALAALLALGATDRGPSSAEPFPVFAGSLPGPTAPMLAAMPAPLDLEALPAPPLPARAPRVPVTAVPESPAAAKDRPSEKVAERPRLTAEKLEDFRIHGVTADFIREIEALGYTHASAATLVSLRIHGISAGFLHRINEVFGERISLDAAVDLRIHGVGPDFAKEMSRVFGKLSPDAVESLRIHGVSPAYAAAFREQGYLSLSVDQAITLRNHGVAPDAAVEFVKMGLPKPSLEELLLARNHGVSVHYVRAMRDAGFPVPSLDVLVTLRSHGVTPEYLKAMREIGYAKLSADEAIALRDHGVTPNFVGELRALGYTGLSVDEVVSLRNHGITADFARKVNASAGKRLSVDELIDSRIWRRREP